MTQLTIHERLGCFGYYGFGGGWNVVKREVDVQGGELYCGVCPRASECWQRHRERCREIAPALCEVWDEMLEEGLTGPDAMVEFIRRTGQDPEGPVSEPYTSISAGNIEDGMAVALVGSPKERGAHTLPWPFTDEEES